MKRTIIAMALAVVAVMLAACASPRTASIEDGKVSNITSAEAVTLVKQDIRRKKVEDVQKNQKPIVRLTANAGKPITIDAATFEVYAPLDERELLAEQADALSENVQMVREVRGIARETGVPLGLGGMALVDRNNSRRAATEQAQIQAETDRQAANLRATQDARMMDALTERPYFVLPAGASKVE